MDLRENQVQMDFRVMEFAEHHFAFARVYVCGHEAFVALARVLW